MTDRRAINRFIDTFRSLAKPAPRRDAGCYAIEGVRMVRRAFEAGVSMRSVLAAAPRSSCDSADPIKTLLDQLSSTDCDVMRAEADVLNDLLEGRERGLIAGLVDLPQPLSFNRKDASTGQFFLGAVNVTDPGNTGALVRTALAGGAAGLIAVGETDAYHPKAVRTSQGSIFKMPVMATATTAQACAALKQAGIWCVGTVTRGGVTLAKSGLGEQLQTRGGVAMFVGAEGPGLSESDIAAMDQLVSIPMRQGVDSFAINAAAAVALYEIGRTVAING